MFYINFSKNKHKLTEINVTKDFKYDYPHLVQKV